MNKEVRLKDIYRRAVTRGEISGSLSKKDLEILLWTDKFIKRNRKALERLAKS